MRRILASLLLVTSCSACSLQQVASFYHENVSEVTPAQKAHVEDVWARVVALRNARLAVQSEPFLVCTRGHESANVLPSPYVAYNSGGPYYGAYQFLQHTWDTTAAAMGRGDLVGANILTVPWYDQDAVAWYLYCHAGNAPWVGRC